MGHAASYAREGKVVRGCGIARADRASIKAILCQLIHLNTRGLIGFWKARASLRLATHSRLSA
jgi:hypothetical protein